MNLIDNSMRQILTHSLSSSFSLTLIRLAPEKYVAHIQGGPIGAAEVSPGIREQLLPYLKGVSILPPCRIHHALHRHSSIEGHEWLLIDISLLTLGCGNEDRLCQLACRPSLTMDILQYSPELSYLELGYSWEKQSCTTCPTTGTFRCPFQTLLKGLKLRSSIRLNWRKNEKVAQGIW